MTSVNDHDDNQYHRNLVHDYAVEDDDHEPWRSGQSILALEQIPIAKMTKLLGVRLLSPYGHNHSFDLV